MSTKPYSRESLERALIHHGIDYSPPDPSRRGAWLVQLPGTLGRQRMTSDQVYWYVVGVADGKRAEATTGQGSNVGTVGAESLRRAGWTR